MNKKISNCFRKETKWLFLDVILIVILVALSGGCSSAFTIKDESFQATDICDATGTFEISVEDGEVQATAQGDIQTIMLKDGIPSPWCNGLIHQFIGTVAVFGYKFESDANAPLEFKVDRRKGFYYHSGKGTVTEPDGNVVNLP